MISNSRYTNKKSVIVATVIISSAFIAVCAAWSLGWLGRRLPGHSNEVRAVSRQEIDRLPLNPTYNDVARLLKEYMLGDNLVYSCPAKEGGIYIFTFLPTRDASLPGKTPTDEPMLVAVIKADSVESWQKGIGEYVFPASIVGLKFSGFGQRQ